jgi:hypothetical protein
LSLSPHLAPLDWAPEHNPQQTGIDLYYGKDGVQEPLQSGITYHFTRDGGMRVKVDNGELFRIEIVYNTVYSGFRRYVDIDKLKQRVKQRRDIRMDYHGEVLSIEYRKFGKLIFTEEFSGITDKPDNYAVREPQPSLNIFLEQSIPLDLLEPIIPFEYKEEELTTWRLPDGTPHREDGPAVFSSNTEMWYRYGKLHREDGPALKTPTVEKWYLDGLLHRDGGPAIIDREIGREQWWTHGELRGQRNL